MHSRPYALHAASSKVPMDRDFETAQMAPTTPTLGVNRLIGDLPRRERDAVLRHCETLDLDQGSILCEPSQPFRHVYFPVAGFISFVTTLDSHRPLQVGLIGNEGMLGATLVLGVNTAPMQACVQGAGRALRMSATQLLRQLRRNPELRRTLHRYLYIQLAQVSQSAACLHFHEVEPRLAQWLLMTQDRAQSDHFYLTHNTLADLLGVRRSGITIAAGALQRKNIIRHSRGEISIRDRAGLEAASCSCYQRQLQNHMERLA